MQCSADILLLLCLNVLCVVSSCLFLSPCYLCTLVEPKFITSVSAAAHPTQCDNFSFGAAMGMLVIDTILYSFITWYIEVLIAALHSADVRLCSPATLASRVAGTFSCSASTG